MKTEDLLHCEEQLKTTLHSDDKEKLRRKLAQLQREYLRTAQRLQRAERLDTVRRHVRSRITQQNQREAEVQPERSHPVHNSSDAAASGAPQSLQHTDASGAESPKRTNTIRFLLPSDTASPQMPDPGLVTQGSHRRRSALRLRSRRSRLRLESRSAEADVGANNVESGREASDEVRSADSEGAQEKKPRSQETEGVNDSQKCFPEAESECVSLLLTHWNSQGSKKNQSGLASSHSSSGETARRETERKEEEGAKTSEKDSNESGEQNTNEKPESERNPDDAVIVKEEANDDTGGEKTASILDSCTLVEGLLFPVEYYVRTTRRMSSSHSQPDVQAVILSQLRAGRQSRGRGRSRGPRKRTAEPSDRDTRTDFPSPTSEPSTAPPNAPEDPIKCGDFDSSQNNSVAPPPEGVAAGRPARGGGRRRRGRGRGRPRTLRSEISTEGSPLRSTAVETVLLSDEAQSASSHCSESQLSPEVGETPRCSDQPDKVYPIFIRRSQESKDASSWRSLLLPSSPPAATPLLPLPSPRLPLQGLPTSSLHLDFHLPDEQFASLKLLKLRQISLESGAERFSSPSHNTRSRDCSRGGGSGASTPHPLPLSLTPIITISSSSEKEDAAPQSLSTEGKLAETPIGQAEGDVPETDKEEQREDHRAEIHHSTILSEVQACAGEDCCRHTDEVCEAPTDTKMSDGAHGHLNKRQMAEEEEADCGEDQMCVNTVHEAKQPPETVLTPPLPTGHEDSGVRAPPVLASPPACTFITPHPPSPTLLTSPVLPSLGLTPHPLHGTFPLTSSPSAPSLTLPPPHSPSTQALSPPTLSPCLPVPHLHPSQLPDSPSSLIHPSPELQFQDSSGGHTNHGAKDAAEKCIKTNISHTLKAAAGGHLVDACCFPGPPGPPGPLCVAAAGTWAVCLWSQTSASGWSLKHTWTFNEPVVNVFCVPDAAGLICVTLGQLEIREVRLLSCSGLTQKLLCEGVIQAVVGVSGSRLVTSSPSATGSTLQVFTLSASSSSLPTSSSLAPPGVSVGTLAPVDHLPDALIGTDESGNLFVWNLKSGRLLCRITLGDGLSHSACLRGFSHCGVLFVLLQHHFLSSPEEEDDDREVLKEERRPPLFSLVAVNPLSRKSVLATRLFPPAAWSGRLCEADVTSSRVVGLSQNGCVCVWELGRGGAQRVLRAPESEGWQLARWGAGDTLVTGQPNGDVTLHCWKSVRDWKQAPEDPRTQH